MEQGRQQDGQQDGQQKDAQQQDGQHQSGQQQDAQQQDAQQQDGQQQDGQQQDGQQQDAQQQVVHPARIFVLCGKRKSGKDFVTEALRRRVAARLGRESAVAVLRLSAPLKARYAAEHELDAGRLMDASQYKEQYRVDMIRWGEARRQTDPTYFCRLVVESAPAAAAHVWIVSDARRRTDLEFFRQNYGVRVGTVRVRASEEVRTARGWTFTAGVDDAESECGLDLEPTDLTLDNDGNQAALDHQLQLLVDQVQH